MRKVLVVFAMMTLANAAFGCDVKLSGKWIEDVPCCLMSNGVTYKRCEKYSRKDFYKMTNCLERIGILESRIRNCKNEEKKDSLKSERATLNKELKDLTGYTVYEAALILKEKCEAAGLRVKISIEE